MVDKLMTLLTRMGNLHVLPCKEDPSVESLEFLNTAMTVKDSIPAMLYQVRQMDHLIGSTSKGNSHFIWLIRTSHNSRNDHRAHVYRMVPL